MNNTKPPLCSGQEMNFYEYLKIQRAWSRTVFGLGPRTEGILKHIETELDEVRKDPYSFEWIDIIILALDGMWRTGASLRSIEAALEQKQNENLSRTWPDPAKLSQDKPSEHIEEKPAKPGKEDK